MKGMRVMKVLNCSKNGELYSHPCVYVTELFGQKNSVEGIFKSVRMDEKGQIAKSLNETRYLRIKNRQLPRELLESFYYAIWYQAFCRDKNLVKYILQYDSYEDGKSEKCMNSQAKVFRIFKEGGKPALKEHSDAFAQALASAPIDFYPIQTTANRIAKQSVVDAAGKESAKEKCINVLHQSNIYNADTYVSKLCDAYYDFYSGKVDQNQVKQTREKIKNEYIELVLSSE